MMPENRKPKETYSYQAYIKYRDGFLADSNILAVMNEARRFYSGDQYDKGLDPNLPKPVMNIVFKYVENVSPKIVGTPWEAEFTTDDDTYDPKRMDSFYSYQMSQMDDKDFTARMVHRALIDGVACAFTVYDEDSYGYKGKYRGFLKRIQVPFEDVFFANPYCTDPQDQEYIGFVQRMPVRAVWDILERSGDKSLKRLVVPDSYDWSRNDYNEDEIASKTCTVVTRYYRDKDGEVMFDVATRYAELYKAQHYLNPSKTEASLREVSAEEAQKTHDDYDMAPGKTTLQTPPIRETERGYEEKIGRFYRYPFSWYRPYPVEGKVLGNSVVTQLIPTQKVINFYMMMNAMSAQNHGMPKWAVMDGALDDGEEINNDPGQVLRIRLKPGQGAIGNVIQRIDSAATSGDLLNLATATASLVEQVYGFENLMADGNINDTSGFALQQVQKQKNLVLEIPQARLWQYLKENARTDLLFYRHYVDEALFEIPRDDGEIQNQENRRTMLQEMARAKGQRLPGSDELGNLPKTGRSISESIGREDFARHWEVSIDVTEGIAGSQIAESQHIQNVFASFNTGNVDASVMRMEIESDPAISRHNRQVILNSITAMENSQLAQKQAEIDQLKQVLTQMQQRLEYYGQQVSQANERVKAYKQATEENAAKNQALIRSLQEQQNMDDYSAFSDSGTDTNATGIPGTMSEGEAKSNNAKGISGSDWSQFFQ